MQLSPHRTFVIQLAAGTRVIGRDMVGRIEHVVSHQTTNFDSLDTLLAFIAEVLPEAAENPPERDS